MESKEKTPLTTSLTLLLSITCGVAVTNMCYIQLIGTKIAASLSASIGVVGILTVLTQLGYALGLLFLVPLGDVMDCPKLVIRTATLSATSLLAAFLAPSFALFACTSFLIGLLSTTPQITIPYGAILARPKVRGKVMGTLLSSLLVGIPLSRTVSGIVAGLFSWRMTYLSALCAVGILILLPYWEIPRSVQQSSTSVSYLDPLKGLPHLAASQRLLREAAVSGFFMLGTFSIFWSTLIFYISSPAYNWGIFEAGILATFGLSGAIAVPIMGRLVDSYSERKIVYMELVMQTIDSTALLVDGSRLAISFLAIILLDVGNQSGQAANQTRVQGLDEAASNRDNTVFMFMHSTGGVADPLLGTIIQQQYDWLGVTVNGLAFQGCALFSQFIVFRKGKEN